MLRDILSPIIGLAGCIAIILGATLAIASLHPSPAWHLSEDCAQWIELNAAFKEDRAQ
jgi:hypothetical protein